MTPIDEVIRFDVIIKEIESDIEMLCRREQETMAEVEKLEKQDKRAEADEKIRLLVSLNFRKMHVEAFKARIQHEKEQYESELKV